MQLIPYLVEQSTRFVPLLIVLALAFLVPVFWPVSVDYRLLSVKLLQGLLLVHQALVGFLKDQF